MDQHTDLLGNEMETYEHELLLLFRKLEEMSGYQDMPPCATANSHSRSTCQSRPLSAGWCVSRRSRLMSLSHWQQQ